MKDLKDHKPKSSTGKRKFHQKSRAGCATCKRRRVKCDEAKPICMKCRNLSLDCGYITDPPAEDEHHRRKSSVSSDERSAASYDIKKEVIAGLSPELSNLTARTLSTSSSPSNGLPANGIQQTAKAPDISATTTSLEDKKAALKSSLLNAGNLNNVNLSHLVHSLTELGGDLSSLGNLASLSNLATLAQLPIDIGNLGALIDGAFQGVVPPKKPETKEDLAEGEQKPNDKLPNISPNVNTQPSSSFQANPMSNPMAAAMGSGNLNMLDLRLMFHYTSQVASTITGAGISDTNIWNYDIPMLAFDHPFLMHSILAFSATHLSRTEKGLDQCVTFHRGDALKLLREAVFDINADNTDALVASALILIMDSLANASFPASISPKSLPASAWIFHVKGAATILTAVWPLTEASRFYKFISVDLGDLGDIINQRVNLGKESLSDSNMYVTDLECHDADIADLFPVPIDSPYLVTLAYLNKLHKERYKSDFILRIFAFPALLDKAFLSLLMSGDVKSMRIMRSYYKLLRSFTMEMKDKVWFLEGVSNVLPVDVEQYAGGAGGMHMMLDFLGGGPSIIHNELDDEIKQFDPTGSLSTKLADTDKLPSEIANDLEIMQAADTFMNMK